MEAMLTFLNTTIDLQIILDQIQTVLADSIPSETSISPVDTYDVPAEVLEQI